jgi:hypothetical protein
VHALWNKRELKRQHRTVKKKQAIEVNKGREWIGGERIPNYTICTLQLGRDRNKVGIRFTSTCVETSALTNEWQHKVSLVL